MTPETEATLQRLAAMECPEPWKPNHYWNGWPKWQCTTCHGTGRRFWRLVEACGYGSGVILTPRPDIAENAVTIEERHRNDCQPCQGTGYVLATTDLLERVEDCFNLWGEWEYAFSPNPGHPHLYSFPTLDFRQVGLDRRLTAIDALAAAVERETVEAK